MVEPGFHAESRPPIVETEATHRALVLAEMVQNPVLFVHVGSAVSLGWISTEALPKPLTRS